MACCLALSCGLTPVALALAPKVGEPVAVLALRPASALAAVAAGTEILWMSAGGHVVVLRAAATDLDALHRDPTTLVLAAASLAGCLPEVPANPSLTGIGRR